MGLFRRILRRIVLGKALSKELDEMEQNGNFKCYCPCCGDILNYNEKTREQSGYEYDGLVRYNCTCCGQVSQWNMDAPVPLLVKHWRH